MNKPNNDSEQNKPIYTYFSQKITALGFSSYEEYLESEWWKTFRKKFFRSRVTKKYCLVCAGDGEYNYTVELHHLTYDRLGAERLKDVIPLCREHHEQVHEILKREYNNDISCTERVVYSASQKVRRRRKGPRRKYRGGK